ncbi:MAG: tRNA (adenosine(37)-N6)-dimethylallyltransferase MiaA [Bacteriovoracaceae bacterium]|nr:tRNA (adenosine(37)-N6)-dimethylallyltransferase MiaA [Bacteriovoracaceae bacterium]
MIQHPVFTISGPTASGKTSFSIALAKRINSLDPNSAVIVNFDSLLFYKEISIGTAKPSLDERDGVEHRMIDICSAKFPTNASEYVERAREEVNKIHEEGRIPILVGGSGFYLRSLIKGMYEAATPSIEVKERVDQMYADKGIDPFRKVLKENDPETYQLLHENDHYRIQRAVEFYWTTGNKISDERKKMDERDPYDFSKDLANEWHCHHVYLDLDKETHWKIIHQRAEEMVKLGLEDEVRNLLDNGFTGEESPLQSIGYKEMVGYIKGEFSTMEDCLERISISTRQLAKSQRTWYKKIGPKNQYNPLTDIDLFLNDCLSFLKIN